ncbi:hypothetical protein CCR85_06380 [Rhodothalassium salexigens]|uniref:CapA family protein n=1 Tax=Rhodothalassium salexigens TaxID=1086 RepID=UPI00191454A9|nr:CapA family protein [Rhodothalassium salexigens]MBK5911117.1 hypothetical protein [Rhodothalassium salexigens]MBK5919465.1 hypothetical protein [Rhodothalassium salexigens]
MTDATTLFLAGDVMLGRGVDQIQAAPGDPVLFESHAASALSYVALAERRRGAIRRAVAPDYVWGALLPELARRRPDLRLVNLETAVTRASAADPKGINYRMNPANRAVLTAAGIDLCVLANNHVLDWGLAGLVETLDTLDACGIAAAGAGIDAERAAAPAVLPLVGGRRALVIAFALPSSGVPADWAAGHARPGVYLVQDRDRAVADIAAQVRALSRPGDVVVASIHWGGNWGYAVPAEDRALAHALIDAAGVHVVHGHSSHHPKGVERHGAGLILYGCGDLINDYEGIEGREAYRGDLVLAYFVTLHDDRVHDLAMPAFRLSGFCLVRASEAERHWLAGRLSAAGGEWGARLRIDDADCLRLAPPHSAARR